ncbi:hypothetical protein LEN26_007576 [Aphanomyces euteiches]|nr:hypothetical protein AeMF1_007487 [Aphanomyces euteiches]KAH9131819.1 hypothetical protein LEN26_007576 [Aphanomyces euteiches]KAH9192053.1 hypothetical protein AeNC1_005968 [Aphanomyces euteiches]
MTTVAFLCALAVVPAAVQGAECTANDFAPIMQPLAKCAQNPGAADIATDPTGATADTITKLCKIDDCKTAFKMIATLNTCNLKNEGLRRSFFCQSSASASTIASGAAILLASVVAMLF